MHRYRSHTCGALRESDIGQTARLSGWCHRIRDHGGVLFIDLRDHYGITQCVADPDSPAFRHDVAADDPFSRNPLYAAVHEASYADGSATRWSAHRLLPQEYEAPELFTGEHVYPWMFEDYRALTPLREAADILAGHEWPRLYDAAALRANEVPVAASIYEYDLYVERDFAVETAALIRGCRPWITNEYEHNGLRANGEHVLSHLLDLARGRA